MAHVCCGRRYRTDEGWDGGGPTPTPRPQGAPGDLVTDSLRGKPGPRQAPGDVAQPGRAPALQAGCRRFESGLLHVTDPAVDHPKHYNAHPSGVECIDVVEHMTFNTGNAIKYLWRAGLKPGAHTIQELQKAAWYIQREIDRLIKGGDNGIRTSSRHEGAGSGVD